MSPLTDVYKKNRDEPLFGYSPELTKDATEYKAAVPLCDPKLPGDYVIVAKVFIVFGH